jgi:hypothetical protein
MWRHNCCRLPQSFTLAGMAVLLLATSAVADTLADNNITSGAAPRTMTAAPLPGAGTQDNLLKWALGAWGNYQKPTSSHNTAFKQLFPLGTRQTSWPLRPHHGQAPSSPLPIPAAHSDPAELRRAAADARRGADAGSADFLERQARVQELLEAMKAEPSEAELMQASRDAVGGTLTAARAGRTMGLHGLG